MAERDPIDLIKDQLNRVDEMSGLHADHENFKHWQSETKMILEKVFSSKSIYYQNFLALRFREMSVKAFASMEIDKINAVGVRGVQAGSDRQSQCQGDDCCLLIKKHKN